MLPSQNEPRSFTEASVVTAKECACITGLGVSKLEACAVAHSLLLHDVLRVNRARERKTKRHILLTLAVHNCWESRRRFFQSDAELLCIHPFHTYQGPEV